MVRWSRRSARSRRTIGFAWGPVNTGCSWARRLYRLLGQGLPRTPTCCGRSIPCSLPCPARVFDPPGEGTAMNQSAVELEEKGRMGEEGSTDQSRAGRAAPRPEPTENFLPTTTAPLSAGRVWAGTATVRTPGDIEAVLRILLDA